MDFNKLNKQEPPLRWTTADCFSQLTLKFGRQSSLKRNTTKNKYHVLFECMENFGFGLPVLPFPPF